LALSPPMSSSETTLAAQAFKAALSLDPPLALAHLASSAGCHAVLTADAPHAIHFLRTDQVGLALRLGRSGHASRVLRPAPLVGGQPTDGELDLERYNPWLIA